MLSISNYFYLLVQCRYSKNFYLQSESKVPYFLCNHGYLCFSHDKVLLTCCYVLFATVSVVLHKLHLFEKKSFCIDSLSHYGEKEVHIPYCTCRKGVCVRSKHSLTVTSGVTLLEQVHKNNICKE